MTLLVVSTGIAFLLVGGLLPFLRRTQFVDVPNHRSSHAVPIPRGGGAAVVVAVVVTLLLAREFTAWPVIGAGVVMALVGLTDDRRPVSGPIRLFAQVLTAAMVGWWLLLIEHPSWMVILGAVLVMVGFVNAFNFMDGINGISGLTGVVIGLYWAAQGASNGLPSVQALGLVVAGAALGFLPWNTPRARVFLGDVGSYGLGFLTASMSVLAWVYGVHWLLAVAPLVVYGADTGWVLIKRLKGRRPLMEAHREHVYQCLVDGGWPHVAAAGLCAASTALACGCAAAMWSTAPVGGAVIIALIVLAYLSAPRLVSVSKGQPG